MDILFDQYNEDKDMKRKICAPPDELMMIINHVQEYDKFRRQLFFKRLIYANSNKICVYMENREISPHYYTYGRERINDYRTKGWEFKNIQKALDQLDTIMIPFLKESPRTVEIGVMDMNALMRFLTRIDNNDADIKDHYQELNNIVDIAKKHMIDYHAHVINN